MKYTLIILFILVVLAYVFKDKLNLGKSKLPEQAPDQSKNPTPSQQPQGTKFPLKKGSVSPLVGELQKALKIKVDNVWGNDTEKALLSAGLPNVFNSEKELKGALAGVSIVKNIFKTI